MLCAFRYVASNQIHSICLIDCLQSQLTPEKYKKVDYVWALLLFLCISKIKWKIKFSLSWWWWWSKLQAFNENCSFLLLLQCVCVCVYVALLLFLWAEHKQFFHIFVKTEILRIGHKIFKDFFIRLWMVVLMRNSMKY